MRRYSIRSHADRFLLVASYDEASSLFRVTQKCRLTGLCPSKGDGRKAGQGPMWAALTVAAAPVFGHAANLGQAGGHITVQNLGAIGAIDVFDQFVLSRLTWLDVHQFKHVSPGQAPQRDADELGTAAQAKTPWC